MAVAKGSPTTPPNRQASAWQLERTYPQHFGRPDIQLSLNQNVSTGPTNVVVIGPERAKILVARHEQIRARTKELVDKVGRGQPTPAREIEGNGIRRKNFGNG
jgi:hypothetical protein